MKVLLTIPNKQILKMKQFLSCLIILFSLALPLQAQSERAADSLAYGKYLSANELRSALSPETILEVYSTLVAQEQKGNRQTTGDARSAGYLADQYQALSGVIMQPDMVSYYNWQRTGDSAHLSRQLKKRMKAEIGAYRQQAGDLDSARQALAADLVAFDTCSHNKPLFFRLLKSQETTPATFATEIYTRSILTTPHLLKAFMKRPSAEALRRDPGVQLILGLALYELWLKRGGEAETAEGQP